ncbi:MAG: hypothetical protein NTZ65_00370 [Candidatus Berkelbacteria bacterium]|nr:hypothetical protein [Candidatus Berkelbacteria bacterium]
MKIVKTIRDNLVKVMLGQYSVPRGLFDSREYFRENGFIHFNYEKTNKGIVARSTNFRWGAIITFGKNPRELDRKIKDAILTSFEIPSSYAKEAKIQKVGAEKKGYALA